MDVEVFFEELNNIDDLFGYYMLRGILEELDRRESSLEKGLTLLLAKGDDSFTDPFSEETNLSEKVEITKDAIGAIRNKRVRNKAEAMFEKYNAVKRKETAVKELFLRYGVIDEVGVTRIQNKIKYPSNIVLPTILRKKFV